MCYSTLITDQLLCSKPIRNNDVGTKRCRSMVQAEPPPPPLFGWGIGRRCTLYSIRHEPSMYLDTLLAKRERASLRSRAFYHKRSSTHTQWVKGFLLWAMTKTFSGWTFVPLLAKGRVIDVYYDHDSCVVTLVFRAQWQLYKDAQCSCLEDQYLSCLVS